jgi:DNA polymerase-3 subunit epsilon
MKLSFDQPACFIDLETTGVSIINDRIVSIAAHVIKPGFDFGNDILCEKDVQKKYTLVNPIFPIPQAATDVHGITNEMVKDAPTFRQISKSFLEFIQPCIIITYNGNNFDVPLLIAEFDRAQLAWDYQKQIFIDTCTIFKRKQPRDLSAAYNFYTKDVMQDAHNAEADVKATVAIFQGQINLHEDLPTTAKELSIYSNMDKPIVDVSGKFSTDPEGNIIFNFGKHVGKKAITEKQYLEWMITPKAEFAPDTKAVARKILFPKL